MPRPRIQHRRNAVDWIASEHLRSDSVTTHQVWHRGQELLHDGSTWPRHLKQAFRALRSPDHLGQVLSRHPHWEHAGRHEVGGGTATTRVRSTLWVRRRD